VLVAFAPAAAAGPSALNDYVENGTFTDNALQTPTALTVGPSGDVYVAQEDRSNVEGTLDTLVKHYSPAGADLGSFQRPFTLGPVTGMDTDSEGDVFVTSQMNGTVVEFTAGGALMQYFGGYPSTDQSDYLSSPGPLAVYRGSVFVADTKPRIERYATDGTPNGQIPLARGWAVAGLATGATGRLYALERYTSTDDWRVQRFDPTGRVLGSFALPNQETGWEWSSIAVDSDDQVIVQGHRHTYLVVRKYTPGGVLLSDIEQEQPLRDTRLTWPVATTGRQVYAVHDGEVRGYAPRAEATPVRMLESDRAGLTGVVRPGGTATTYEFFWRTSDSGTYHSLGEQPALTGTGELPVAAPLDGLLANHRYLFKLRVKPGAGVARDTNTVAFTTPPPPPPEAADIALDPVTGLGRTQATISADVAGHGGTSAVRVLYQTDPGGTLHSADMHTTDPQVAPTRRWRHTLTALQPGTRYRFLIQLNNPSGGPVLSSAGFFTTTP
jgi:hypothetical protein